MQIACFSMVSCFLTFRVVCGNIAVKLDFSHERFQLRSLSLLSQLKDTALQDIVHVKFIVNGSGLMYPACAAGPRTERGHQNVLHAWAEMNEAKSG